MAQDNKQSISSTVQWTQLAVIAIGVIGFFVNVGKQTQMLDKTTQDLGELKLIVQDLVKAQIQVVTNDATTKLILEDLRFRVLELERKK